ncbi:hypothetical protein ACLKMH_22365 [Psychromonas sp. KJ10-10]|uniref:hypothetical protein n=1 Tax=Psychromonas sp. KJ10-10 TaxID=3391823 RepID=UPI0039B6C49E
MLKFTKDYNCCKTVGHENFGVTDSESYIQQSERLGYVSTECQLCGSNAPWINNELVQQVLEEKLDQQFAKKVVGCKKCDSYFFISSTPDSKRHGYTSAGTQRKKCSQCNAIFTLPDFKNTVAMKIVLASLLGNKDIKTAVSESGLSARLYYFYLNKLAILLSNFSRDNESKHLTGDYIGLHSEGRLLELKHKRGIYLLFSAEIDSGYILLQTHNLTKRDFAEEFIYHEKESTIATNINSNNLETVLLARYQRNLERNHFEQLIMGDIKPIVKCNAIYPDKVAYIHFQLLKVFTGKVKKYDHFIEHESTLRSASLMSSYNEIKSKDANVYYFLPFEGGEHFNGKRLGWWNDIWFSNNVGAFCPITCKLNPDTHFRLNKGEAIESFFQYLNMRVNKSVSSMQVIDNLLEIYRVIYNYCIPIENKTPACVLGISEQSYTPEQLFELALKQITRE